MSVPRTTGLFAVLLLAACGRAEAPTRERVEPAAPVAPVAVSDPAVPIRVAAGAEFEIVLAANATTGYQWALSDALPTDVVRRLSNEYEPDPAPAGGEPQTGAGGRERWRFRAVGPGQAAIPLVLRRTWEADAPVDSARFQVVVVE